jgi:hypothetical protein
VAYFKRLKSNIKGGVDVELGPKVNVIYGGNRTKKTAVQQTWELATRGSVSDLALREDVRDTRLLFTLGDGTSLWASAITDEDVEFSYSTTKKGKSVSTPDFDPPEEVLWPVLDVESMLKGSAETQRNWILSVAGQFSRKDVIAHISNVDLYTTEAEDCPATSEQDILEQVLARAKSKASVAKKAMTRHSGAVEAMSRGLAAEPSEDTLKRARELVAELESTLPEPVAPAPAPSIFAPPAPARITEAQVAEARAAAVAAIGVYQQNKEALQAARAELEQTKLPATASLQVKLAETVRAVVPYNPANCMVCGQATSQDWSVLADYWEALAKALIQQRDRHQEVAQRVGQLEYQTKTSKGQAESVGQRFSRLHGAFETQGPAPAPSPAPAPQDNTDREAYQDHVRRMGEAAKDLADLEAAVGAWQRVRDERELLREAKDNQREYEALKQDCQSAQKEMVRYALDLFRDTVQSFLPDDIRFSVEISGQSVYIGVEGENGPRLGYSGVESAAVTMACAAAYIQLRKHDGLVVIAPKERAWDPETLGAAVRSFQNAPGQVLIVATVRPKGRFGKDVNLVEMV